MASDQLVHARLVLQAQLRLRRGGVEAALRNLEQVEPDLAEYVMETLSLLHKRLLGLGGSEKQTRRLTLQIQTLVLVSIESLRQAHRVLWEQQMGPALGQLDSDPQAPDSPSDPSGAGA